MSEYIFDIQLIFNHFDNTDAQNIDYVDYFLVPGGRCENLDKSM